MIQEAPIKPPYEQIETISSNALTLQSYELGVQEYIDGTAAEVSGEFKNWVDMILGLLSPNAKIMEIGSGFGRDANYMESFGFQVERTDAAEAFVTFLKCQGYPARKFDILRDVFSRQYDLIFANAVFLHFTPEELQKVLQKIHASLGNDGVLAFSVKTGEGQEWTKAKLGRLRYFCYWDQAKLIPLLQNTHFEVISLSDNKGFLQIIAKPIISNAKETKEQVLAKLEQIGLDELWVQFLKMQSDLFFEKEFAPIFNQLWWHQAHEVLEIGSGNGDVLAKIRDTFPNKNYVGLELKPSCVLRSQNHYQSDHLTFIEGDAECFRPEFSNRFDVVILRLTLQHLKQPKTVLEHVSGYLKTGGHVFIIESHDASGQSSYPTPILDQAVEQLNHQNRTLGQGNRFISLEVQRELHAEILPLSSHFSIRMSNLDHEGSDVHPFPQVVISGLEAGFAYRDYYLMFLHILHKQWNIPIDFDRAYEEGSYLMENKNAWRRSGKHLLLLEKK